MRKKRTTYKRILDKLPAIVKKRAVKVMYKFVPSKKSRLARKTQLPAAGAPKI